MRLLAVVALVAAASCLGAPAQAMSAMAPADIPKLGDTCLQCLARGKKYWCPSKNKCFDHDWTCGLECSKPCEETRACKSGCESGFNCTCSQCADHGYSEFCSAASECYHSTLTCEISCGKGNCAKTAQCTMPMICSAAQVSQCPNATQTCCLNSDGQPFCSSYPNATCCQYNDFSCPKDSVCYPVKGKCLPPPPTPPPECAECEQVVASIETDGCDKCSELFPALSWLCLLLQKMGMCSWIQNHALPPKDVCEMIGFCGSEGCTCGYCRPQLYAQWCLAMPNKCPAGGAAATSAVGSNDGERMPETFSSAAKRDAFVARRLKRVEGGLRRLAERKGLVLPGLQADPKAGSFCLDKMCDENHLGCCLTCAP